MGNGPMRSLLVALLAFGDDHSRVTARPLVSSQKITSRELGTAHLHIDSVYERLCSAEC